MHRRLRTLVIPLACLGLVPVGGDAAQPAAPLSLVFLSDLGGDLAPQRCAAPAPARGRGLPALAALVQRLGEGREVLARSPTRSWSPPPCLLIACTAKPLSPSMMATPMPSTDRGLSVRPTVR